MTNCFGNDYIKIELKRYCTSLAVGNILYSLPMAKMSSFEYSTIVYLYRVILLVFNKQFTVVRLKTEPFRSRLLQMLPPARP